MPGNLAEKGTEGWFWIASCPKEAPEAKAVIQVGGTARAEAPNAHELGFHPTLKDVPWVGGGEWEVLM